MSTCTMPNMAACTMPNMSTCTMLLAEPMSGLLSSPTIYLDEKGDLRLRVGGEVDEVSQDFVVCSRALGRSSPVLKTMLFGGFAESRPAEGGGEWSVDLPEDATEAMEIVLNIVHGRFNLVPEKLSLSRLYDVLTITEKYDMTVITRPWARSWMQGVKHQTDNPFLLCVAWELGDAEVFEEMYRKMTYESTIDLKGRLVFGHAGRVWKKGPDGYNLALDKIVYLRPHGLFGELIWPKVKVCRSVADMHAHRGHRPAPPGPDSRQPGPLRPLV